MRSLRNSRSSSRPFESARASRTYPPSTVSSQIGSGTVLHFNALAAQSLSCGSSINGPFIFCMWQRSSIASSRTWCMNAEPAIRRLCMLNDPQLERESEDRQGQSPQSAAQTWLSIRQLQDLLNIGHTKAYSLVASGEIPSVKIGRIIRINQQDLSEWLNQQKYGSVND